MRIFGSRALVTGASGGLGAAIARELDARGAELVLSARREEALEELRDELGGRPQLEPADLAGPGAAADLAERAGRVDVLVANAALPGSGQLDGLQRRGDRPRDRGQPDRARPARAGAGARACASGARATWCSSAR